MSDAQTRSPAQAGAHHLTSPADAAPAARSGDGPLPAQVTGYGLQGDFTGKRV